MFPLYYSFFFYLIKVSTYFYLKKKKKYIYIYIFEQVPSKVGGVDGDIDIMTRWWWKFDDSIRRRRKRGIMEMGYNLWYNWPFFVKKQSNKHSVEFLVQFQILKFSCLTQSSLKLTSINLGLPHDTNLRQNILRNWIGRKKELRIKMVFYNL